MIIEYVDQLLCVPLTIMYKVKKKAIEQMIIDTGAAHSIISSDVADEIRITFEDGDEIVRSFGIGAEEFSFRKQIQQIEIGTYRIENFTIDFGVLPEKINGLIGLDTVNYSHHLPPLRVA
ncbi:retropepsin-like domain-containing protein [Aquibacillus sp. 3ASR75-11]|uniref:Retropepsin-like domain-containing protein n=1 Tax=Terrihalobacillus insolitus TaxID=2950438 RepID=A0A9X4AQ49_9BACI|nr:retropepsin-like aspartic protease [Terrihalobacillus insolitus]MDC3426145.1 retropepsin-like domain-containing protein [Terrihalobacillus insolitus]